MDKLENNVLYILDKAFRSYHQYASNQLKKHGFSITVDQWLVLKTALENPELSQKQLSDVLYKDNASITRIIQHLEKSEYLTTSQHPSDRRRTILKITDLGKKITSDVHKIALKNREIALTDISTHDINTLNSILQKIINNTKP
ncbi:MarR family winged helix-turn-helix transcriptional regulator [Pedobacter flavus]|uniref:MarR family transcriptional regulator n=1 Tax=Pedobacter flavus TaxID=3113906 RepID=A0ABU7GZD7_9SPHI|nr:MarR family transcriptional regulator [Pedobacter sp. VNH31]MEE1884396.1 MarR family transcriptional regulator [Pedobacter sp. VNH31]